MTVLRISAASIAPARRGRKARAFTLLEMLIVLIIIGLLAALALPHMRGNTESVAINAACRQLVADLSLARQRAISQRSTVAVVFVPREVREINFASPVFSPAEQEAIKRLQAGSYTHYALFTYRRTGEQPGSRTVGYISEWKSLPEKTFIDPAEFDDTTFFFRNGLKFPFPFSDSIPFDSPGLPYIAFDHEGRCVVVDLNETGAGRLAPTDRVLRVARGAILYTRDPQDGSISDANFEVQQIPPYNSTNNLIHVNALTGRAKRVELQLH